MKVCVIFLLSPGIKGLIGFNLTMRVTMNRLISNLPVWKKIKTNKKKMKIMLR